MASSTKNENKESANDGDVNAVDGASEVTVGKDAEQALEDFYAKKLSPGTRLRFVTRGGQTIPQIRKV